MKSRVYLPGPYRGPQDNDHTQYIDVTDIYIRMPEMKKPTHTYGVFVGGQHIGYWHVYRKKIHAWPRATSSLNYNNLELDSAEDLKDFSMENYTWNTILPTL